MRGVGHWILMHDPGQRSGCQNARNPEGQIDRGAAFDDGAVTTVIHSGLGTIVNVELLRCRPSSIDLRVSNGPAVVVCTRLSPA